MCAMRPTWFLPETGIRIGALPLIELTPNSFFTGDDCFRQSIDNAIWLQDRPRGCVMAAFYNHSFVNAVRPDRLAIGAINSGFIDIINVSLPILILKVRKCGNIVVDVI